MFKISKHQAKHRFEHNLPIVMCPSKYYPTFSHPFNLAVYYSANDILRYKEENAGSSHGISTFDVVINAFSYYQCTNETGKNIHFYILESEFNRVSDVDLLGEPKADWMWTMEYKHHKITALRTEQRNLEKRAAQIRDKPYSKMIPVNMKRWGELRHIGERQKEIDSECGKYFGLIGTYQERTGTAQVDGRIKQALDEKRITRELVKELLSMNSVPYLKNIELYGDIANVI